MSKAVLIIDMPESCKKCMNYVLGLEYNFCGVTNFVVFDRNVKASHCPLKPLPEEDNDDHLSEWGRGYQGGWNDCINAIYKE